MPVTKSLPSKNTIDHLLRETASLLTGTSRNKKREVLFLSARNMHCLLSDLPG